VIFINIKCCIVCERKKREVVHVFATASIEEGQLKGLMDTLQIVIMALIDNLVLGYL
jgi:hypothetical protein